MALTRPQFDLIDVALTSIENGQWVVFEECHSMLRSAYFTEKALGSSEVAEELADSTRRLCKQYRKALESFDTSRWVKTDGGRKAAGHKGDAGDCTIRAISIALGLDYQEVWDEFDSPIQSPDNGVHGRESSSFLEDRGWTASPVGRCTVAEAADKWRTGIIDCSLLGDGHFVAIIDGKIYDTWNSSGLRVNRLWSPPNKEPQGLMRL